MTVLTKIAAIADAEIPSRSSSFLRSASEQGTGELLLSTTAGVHRLPIDRQAQGVSVRLPDIEAQAAEIVAAAAVEYLSAQSREIEAVELHDLPIGRFGLRSGGRVLVDPRAFWQWPNPWIAEPGYPHPQLHVLSNGRYHPKRPPKPAGTVYERYIPWLGQRISFRVAEPEADAPHFHRWMNDEAVNVVWEDGGTLEKHRAILRERHDDPHVLALIGCFDDVPFGYFEVYWAKENRLGPYYDAQDYDRGWHVAVGEPDFRGRKWLTAWLPSLMHFIFLDEPRTQRIVGEPRATHEQQIRNLDRSGFAKVKQFDFPHKRAMLVMLTRERFFGDRLWVPAS